MTRRATSVAFAATLLACSSASLGACSNITIPIDPTGGSGTGTGSGGSGGAQPTGGGEGGFLDQSAVTSTAASTGTGVISPGSACATSTTAASLIPVNIFLLFDRSASMAYKSKWPAATAALDAFFQSSSSAGLRIALRFFPEDGCDNVACSNGPCGQPLVPLGMLLASSAPADAQEQALVTAASNKMPAPNEIMGGGGTPLSAALGGAADWGIAYRAAHPGEKVVVVLVSDGEANGCDPTAATNEGIVAKAHAAGVDTYAIGLAGYFQSRMDALAQAGGTGQAFFIGNTDVTHDLLTALQSVQNAQVSCALPVPEGAPGKPVDPALVNVDYTPGGGVSKLLGEVQDASACGTAGGWYYDNPATPTTITLCPVTCGVVQADVDAKIDIILGCKTQNQPPQ